MSAKDARDNRGSAGRPTKLTPEVADRIVEAVSLGLSYKDAARAGGITEQTLIEWRRQGAEEEGTAFSELFERIDRAAQATGTAYLDAIKRSITEESTITKTRIKRSEDGAEMVEEVVKETRPPGIKGAMWWLERRFPDPFARRIAHGGKVGIETPPKRKVTIKLVSPDGTTEAFEQTGGESTKSNVSPNRLTSTDGRRIS